MRITFFVGATATKLVKGKPDTKATKFFGGETEDIVEAEAKILVPEFAAKADTKEAKEFLKGHVVNPRTRKQNLDAVTPGLYERLAHKKALERVLSTGAKAAIAEARGGGGQRSTRAARLGAELNGPSGTGK